MNLDLDEIERLMLCDADVPCGRNAVRGEIWHEVNALALVAVARWARDHSEHHPQCGLNDCRCGRDEALAPFQDAP